MTKLKAVNIGMNKYCGPAVLSILTGRNTDECAREIRKINGAYEVAGVQLDHLLKAADKLGFNNQRVESQGSLYRTLASLAGRDGIYVITVPSHFVVIEVAEKQIYFCDNHTKEPMRAASSARLMQTCLACYRVERRKDYVEPEPLRLLSKDIAVSIQPTYSDYQLSIQKVFTYNHSEYNRTETVGLIMGLSLDDLSNIGESIKTYVYMEGMKPLDVRD